MDPESGNGTEGTGGEGTGAVDTGGGAGGRELGPQETVESILSQLDQQHEAEVNRLDSGEPTTQTVETQRYKVKVDGQEIEVGLKDLLASYSRQADYTKKTQALAEQRKALETQQKALLESEAYKTLKSLAEKEVGEFDPYDPDSVLAHMRKTAAEQIANMYKPVEEAYITETAKVKAQAFISSKPEFEDAAFKADVRELLKSSQLDLETAYWVVKGKRDTAAATAAKEEATRYRAVLAEAGLKVGSGASVESDLVPPAHVRKQGAFAVANWFAQKKGSW